MGHTGLYVSKYYIYIMNQLIDNMYKFIILFDIRPIETNFNYLPACTAKVRRRPVSEDQ